MSEASNGSDARAARERMTAALAEIRREGYKVAAVYAVVDGAAVALLVTVALQIFGPSLPITTDGTATEVFLAAAVGLLVLIGEFLLRVRRPLVEQFEEANPGVKEALRTARDAAEDGRETPMATMLYGDVIGRLRETTSVGLVNGRRLSATVLLVVVVSAASVQVAVVDFDVRGFGDDDAGQSATPPEYDGLADGDQILGDAENVSAGDNVLNASIGGEGDGDANGSSSAPGAYDTGGFSGSAEVEGQQAGFASDEQLEDADLIRDYNLRIRNETDE